MAGSVCGRILGYCLSKKDFLVVCSGTFFWDKGINLFRNTDVDLAETTDSRGVLGYDKNHLLPVHSRGMAILSEI